MSELGSCKNQYLFVLKTIFEEPVQCCDMTSEVVEQEVLYSWNTKESNYTTPTLLHLSVPY